MTTPVKNATYHNTKGDLFTSFDVADFDVPKGRDEVQSLPSILCGLATQTHR